MNEKNNSIMNSDVAWNSSQLFYQYLYEVDMDYKDNYYANNWDGMYKAFKLKFMKTRVFIFKVATDKEKVILKDDKKIKEILNEMKSGDTDFINNWNSGKIQTIIDIIEQKMILIDELMSKAGMNLLLEKIKEYKPAVLSQDGQ